MKKIRELMEKLNMKRKSNATETDLQSVSSQEAIVVQDIQRRIKMQILSLIALVLLVIVLIFAMTAAWFTNVAKTSDLVFQTESWGFDAEKITLAEESISIAPGTAGVVPLSVDNSDGTASVRIGVTISKASTDAMMDAELQKRIFFYVDVAKNVMSTAASTDETEDVNTTVEEETTSRIYLGTSVPENYTYKILAGQTLTMNELYYNDVPIKWEWVYDMVGYYFRGKAVTDSAETRMVVDEYLRPIEYDYEQAIFDMDETSPTYQQLMTIGTAAKEEFLGELSASDGYAGTIDCDKAVVVNGKIYYPVEVDSKGYGVWAYLCTLEEVEAGIAYDTALANSGENVTATATIILTAMNLPAQIETVNTEAALKDALTDKSVDIVELSADILTGTPISFTEGSKVIDLNGYTLQYDGTETKYDLLSVSDGATLTVINGQINGASASTNLGVLNSNAFGVTAGNLILSNVEVSDFDSAVYVADMNATTGDSTIQITDCALRTAQTTIFLQGNGFVTDTTTKMIIENSLLYSENYMAIMGQGSSSEGNERWGTELVLVDSEIFGYYGGLYQPQQRSSTTISNCKVSGNTAIAVKGGTVNIYESEIIGTGDAAVDEAAVSKSGFVDTGDAVYVEAGYDWSATVILKGNNKVTSAKAYAVELFAEAGKGPGKIMIYDGTYEGAKGSAKWNDIGAFEIYGGIYSGTVSDTITKYN